MQHLQHEQAASMLGNNTPSLCALNVLHCRIKVTVRCRQKANVEFGVCEGASTCARAANLKRHSAARHLLNTACLHLFGVTRYSPPYDLTWHDRAVGIRGFVQSRQNFLADTCHVNSYPTLEVTDPAKRRNPLARP